MACWEQRLAVLSADMKLKNTNVRESKTIREITNAKMERNGFRRL
jgi:hypothetical protein